jgi:hypothetical protein
MTTFSAAEKHKALIREIGFRRTVYPRRVQAGKMTQAQADKQLAIFEAIAADYAELAEGERLI